MEVCSSLCRAQHVLSHWRLEFPNYIHNSQTISVFFFFFYLNIVSLFEITFEFSALACRTIYQCPFLITMNSTCDYEQFIEISKFCNIIHVLQ